MTHPRKLLAQTGIYAGKELGQNFLSDPGIAAMIVEKAAIFPEAHVLEIGPGLGALTRVLAEKAQTVTAVEKDSRLIPFLKQELEESGATNVTVINNDILKQDIGEIAGDKKLVVIGNLPYNISSQVLFRLVENSNCVEKAFLMFQKELAQRILASPGNKAYSRLSAVVQYAAAPFQVVDIGPGAFFPKPSVHSTVLGFDFFESKGLDKTEEQMLFNVIKAAFSKRRKSLKNAMPGGEFGFEKKQVVSALEAAGIDPQRRAETLTIGEFKSLALKMALS